MIVRDPDPILHQQCERVPPGADVTGLVRKLRETMAWSAEQGRPAAGLAAPQIGETVRVFVHAAFPHAFVNPRMLKASRNQATESENCLSFPATLKVPVRRPSWVKIVTEDENRRVHTYKMHGRDARVALHELDHLDGILITDRAA